MGGTGFSVSMELPKYGSSLAEISYQEMFVELPWGVKCLFAAGIDTFPLFGFNRKSYLILSNLLAAMFCWFFFFENLMPNIKIVPNPINKKQETNMITNKQRWFERKNESISPIMLTMTTKGAATKKGLIRL